MAAPTQQIRSSDQASGFSAGRLAGWLAALALFAGYAAMLLAPIYSNLKTSDFAAPFYPASQLMAGGGDPYAVTEYIYMQPPALLLIFQPFTALPLEVARALWLACEIVLLLAGIAFTLRSIDFRLTEPRAAFVALVYLSPNVVWGLMIGQSVILIFFLEALGLLLLRSKRPFLAGLSLGMMVLKPHMLALSVPVLLSASRRAWAGAVASAATLIVLPELLGYHLLVPFVNKLIHSVGEERFNKLNPADMFVNLFGSPAPLRIAGWVVLGLMFLLYLWLLLRIWREQRARRDDWQLTPLVLLAMLAAFMFLPYTLAYDIILVAVGYLWLFQSNGYSINRSLTWSLGLLYLLPILTLVLHAAGIASTLNPLLIIGLFLMLRFGGKAEQTQVVAAGPAVPTV